MELSCLNSLHNKETTRTAKYIMPLLFDDNTIVDSDYGFINAFIGDINKPWLEDKIFLVYNRDEKFRLDIIFKNNPNFFDKYWIVVEGEVFTVYVFNLPHGLKIPIDIIKKGKPSKISIDLKAKIIKFWPDIHFIEMGNYGEFIPLLLDNDIIPIEDDFEDPIEFILCKG